MERLKKLFNEYYGITPDSFVQLSGSGSNRQYYRISSSQMGISAIGTIGTDIKENLTFLYMDDILRRAGVCTPKILAISSDYSSYLQEDLGDVSLFSLKGTDKFYKHLSNALLILPFIQYCTSIDYYHCYPEKEMGEQQIQWDLNYFKYCFLKPAGISFNERKLEDDFNALTRAILETPANQMGFMYRDCQSRNIIIKDDDVYWIDFQSGRYGPGLYDLASLLWQAKAEIPTSKRWELAEIYFGRCNELTGADIDDMRKRLPLFVIFRTLQVLGAYGFRGLVEHKAHFVESIPLALNNLRELLADGFIDEFSELKNCAERLCNENRFTHTLNYDDSKLTVSVLSFSYKKGYPDDFSGNGGGFMFDCRALHNPGRYSEYKYLTGMDKPVKDFLEERCEVQPFLDSTWSLTDNAVERYIQRGFTSIQIGFGCTGGQHRSVYCAEKTAIRLKELFGDKIRVNLIHREQGINKIL